MRIWRPAEETPRWIASRAAQAFYVFCIVCLATGFVCAFIVRVESPWIRVVGAALSAVGLLIPVALLARSQHIRRHR